MASGAVLAQFDRKGPPDMTGIRAIGIVAATMSSLAAIGAGIGYGLGRFTPGYYRSVFPGGNDDHFDPIAVGLGQGLTQGAVGGAVVGLVLIAILCRRDVRCRDGRAVESLPAASDRSERIWEWVFYVTVGLLGLALCCSLSYLIGAVIGSVGAYQRHSMKDRDIASRVLEGDPVFEGVDISEVSNGDVYLSGTVRTAEDLERLRRAIGEAWSDEIVHVEVAR